MLFESSPVLIYTSKRNNYLDPENDKKREEVNIKHYIFY